MHNELEDSIPPPRKDLVTVIVIQLEEVISGSCPTSNVTGALAFRVCHGIDDLINTLDKVANKPVLSSSVLLSLVSL